MTYVPEKAKQIALARLDLVHKWLEFRRKSNIKIQADYDFVKLHNTTDSHLRQVLGKVSRGSLHRWNAMLDGSEDYEKLHSAWHNDYIPTIEETMKMIDMWLNFKNSQTCPNAPNKTIAEVLEDRKHQNINPGLLDDLMLATEVKTIQRNGVRFLGCDYFDERLYGFKSKVLIKYNLFDLTKIKVFTPKGEYLCTAERVTETHPMAKLLGDVKDYEDYKQKIVRQKQLKKKTVNAVKNYFSTEEIKYLETKIDEKISPPVQTSFKENSKAVQTVFINNSQKYEYLIKHDPNNSWISEFKQTKEYRLLYE